MTELLLWIAFGALAGWIASLLMQTNTEQDWLGNIVVGIFGAIIGGYIMRALGGAAMTGFNIGSLLVAVLGSLLLIAALRAIRRSS